MKTIETEVRTFRARLVRSKDYTRQHGYRRIVDQLDIYWEQLFADPIAVNTSAAAQSIPEAASAISILRATCTPERRDTIWTKNSQCPSHDADEGTSHYRLCEIPTGFCFHTIRMADPELTDYSRALPHPRSLMIKDSSENSPPAASTVRFSSVWIGMSIEQKAMWDDDGIMELDPETPGLVRRNRGAIGRPVQRFPSIRFPARES